ncbi:MAG: proline--tRNA ligase, partial [Peptococcaceae bacterium]|nr:proline--tRNA ligase [Peptococcaceae bacterium]
MAEEDAVAKVVNGGFGSLGPVGLANVKIYADLEVEQMTNLVCGANEEAYHFINVNPGRDFQVEGYYDLRMMTEEDPCPKCGQKTDSARGIEVGQVFKLGTKYSEALGAKYLDENGKEQVMHMGCYGIGVSRTMAAAVEQYNDENGIIWPKSIAPYHVVVVPISAKDETQMAIAEQLYADLQKRGVEVMLDDRNERPGVKFKDADLIGYPVRITVGKKSAEEGTVEYKLRTEAENEVVALSEVVEKTVAYIFS